MTVPSSGQYIVYMVHALKHTGTNHYIHHRAHTASSLELAGKKLLVKLREDEGVVAVVERRSSVSTEGAPEQQEQRPRHISSSESMLSPAGRLATSRDTFAAVLSLPRSSIQMSS